VYEGGGGQHKGVGPRPPDRKRPQEPDLSTGSQSGGRRERDSGKNRSKNTVIIVIYITLERRNEKKQGKKVYWFNCKAQSVLSQTSEI